jgi:hypothetical protein
MPALVCLLLGQAPAEPAPPAPSFGVAWSVAAALADLRQQPEALRPALRYLYVGLDWGEQPEATKPAWVAVSKAANVGLSRSPFDIVPMDMHGGRLIRLNLAELALSEADATNLRTTWDSMVSGEPFYHVNTWQLVDAKTVFTTADGRKVSGRWERQTVVHPRLAAGYAELIAGANSPAPLLLAEWATIKILSTVDGGKYYQFRGLRDRNGKALHTLDSYLRSRGADRAASGRVGADERAAIFRSAVTGKPRQIEILRGGGVRPSVGTGLVAITYDISDGQTKVQNDPLANLLDFEASASETILEIANGEHEFAIWNQPAGELVDEVPPDVAADHTIPDPYTRRLQPAVGCLRCHGPQEGWQPFGNDVQRLLGGDVTLVGDLSAGFRAFDATTLVRLRGLYGGNLAEPLRLGRNSLSDVTFRTCGGQTVPEAADAVAQVWRRYEYSLVGPADALAMLGVELPAGRDAAGVFAEVVPRAVGPEEPLIVALQRGIPIQRRQFERVWPDILARCRR